jgi:hypothetical protein
MTRRLATVWSIRRAVLATVLLTAASSASAGSEAVIRQGQERSTVVLRQPPSGAFAVVRQEGSGNLAVIVQGRGRSVRPPALPKRRTDERISGCDLLPDSPCPDAILERHEPRGDALGPRGGSEPARLRAVGRIGDIAPAPAAREELMPRAEAAGR